MLWDLGREGEAHAVEKRKLWVFAGFTNCFLLGWGGEAYCGGVFSYLARNACFDLLLVAQPLFETSLGLNTKKAESCSILCSSALALEVWFSYTLV